MRKGRKSENIKILISHFEGNSEVGRKRQNNYGQLWGSWGAGERTGQVMQRALVHPPTDPLGIIIIKQKMNK